MAAAVEWAGTRAGPACVQLQAEHGDKLTLARATRAFEDACHSGRSGSATT